MLRNQSGAINPLHLVTDITRVSIQFKPPWPRINNSLSLERNHIQFLPSFPRFRPPFSQIIFQIIITRNLKTWAKYLEMCPLPALGLAQLTYSYNLLLFHTFLMLTFSSHFTLAPLVLGSLGWKIQAYLYHRPRRTLLANFIHAGWIFSEEHIGINISVFMIRFTLWLFESDPSSCSAGGGEEADGCVYVRDRYLRAILFSGES